MQCSIWAIPSEPLYSQLQKVIDSLAKKYDGPNFIPHMTLLSGFDKDLTEVEQKTKELVKGVNQLKLSLGPVSFSTTYFQNVLVRVNSTAQLMQLNIDIKRSLKVNNDVYMPHMSLLYGDQDMKTREEAASNTKLPPSSFVVKEFVIYYTVPDTSKWKHLATIPLVSKT